MIDHYEEVFGNAADVYKELYPNEVKRKSHTERFVTNGHIVIDVDK